MNILALLFENWRMGSATIRFPGAAPIPANYRGMVAIEGTKCAGCGMCAHVCASAAIEVQQHEQNYQWTYDGGKCTFCARCVDDCPPRALLMEGQRPPLYARPGELKRVLVQSYPRCQACGRPAHPINATLLEHVFGEPSEAVFAWSKLCDDCRRLHSASTMLPLISGRQPADELEGTQEENTEPEESSLVEDAIDLCYSSSDR